MYVLFATPVLLLVAIALSLPPLIAPPVLGWRRALRAVNSLFLFAGALHVTGLFGSLVFSSVFRDRLYFAADPLIDWLPFLPVMNWTLDPACGGHLLNDATPSEFYLAWFSVAAPVWVGSFFLWREWLKKFPAPAAAWLQV